MSWWRRSCDPPPDALTAAEFQDALTALHRRLDHLERMVDASPYRETLGEFHSLVGQVGVFEESVELVHRRGAAMQATLGKVQHILVRLTGRIAPDLLPPVHSRRPRKRQGFIARLPRQASKPPRRSA